MMIKLKRLNKYYGNKQVLKNIDFSFENSGFYCLCGPSGCGKTTLLNIISSIDNSYDGEILIDNKLLCSFNNEEREKFRLRELGYVFQSFNLFNSDTVYNNILFPLECSTNASKFAKRRKVEDLLQLVGLLEKKNAYVKNLSGGEKQRIAIARSLVNSPEIILCDEPSGALDNKSAKDIFELLKSISKTKLVIVVTHDEELAIAYSDLIVYLNDGEIIKTTKNKDKIYKNHVNIFETKYTEKTPSISFGFVIRHVFSNFKCKKVRSLISNFITSIGLVGVGMSIMLATTLSTNLKSAFSRVVNDRQIVVSLKNKSSSTYGNVFSANKDEATFIAKKYKDDIEGVGINYLVNFENFFKDKNEIYVSSTSFKIPLDKYSIRLINDYRWLDYSDKRVLPNDVKTMEDDQVIIGFDYESMARLCFALKLQRNFETLAKHIASNVFTITINIRNNDWKYNDQQLLKVVGIIEDSAPTFYHTSKVWNKIIFEDKMRIPTTINDNNREYPWMMFKTSYLLTNKDPEKFLNECLFDEQCKNFILERSNYTYYPDICHLGKTCNLNRIMMFNIDKTCVFMEDVRKMQESEPIIQNFVVSTDLGYSMFANNLMVGFSRNFYLSNELKNLETSLDADNNLDINDLQTNIQLPKNVVVGNAIKSANSGLIFSSNLNNIDGKTPINTKEIVISTGLKNKLNNIKLGDNIYVGMPIYCSNKENKVYARETLKLVGTIKDDRDIIYNKSLWSISFFRDCFGISSFYLLPREIIFDISNSEESSKIINRLSNNFKAYSFVNPALEISKTIDETLSYVEIMLLSFSFVALLISFMLFLFVSYINIQESQKEITLMRYIGISKKNIKKVFLAYSLTMGLFSFFTSLAELFILNFLSTYVLSDYLTFNIGLSFSFWPILVIFTIIIVISLMSSGFIKIKTVY